MSKQTLVILYGGRSAEREVSVLSAESVISAVNYDKFTVKTFFISKNGDFIKTQEFTATPSADERLMTNETLTTAQIVSPASIYEKNAVVFPVLHGPMGEDGSIQGFLEILKMPYIGPNITHASVTMDKIMTKHVFTSVNIPQVPYVALTDLAKIDEKMAEVTENLTYPVFVKPANMGSSVGISKVETASELRAAIDEAIKFDSRILIEQGVNAREIEVAVLGNNDVQTTMSGEVVKDVAFYDYKSKYIDNQITMAIPAEIPENVAEKMRKFAETAYRAVAGTGLSRCDFFMTADEQIYLNEINAIPGFTQFSMYPLLWENMGLAYSDLIEKLVELAFETFKARESKLEN
ncbi:D-alanine--D-alanine ligase [Lactococcus hodotermopsidis]|uniref:D-alanine--D-alanine ligase n=1 Tax=Pseudolactococcus hodotermopsidis TaxID=2709157 RepID=A0A6A0BAX5_9LACT|nr:D-alanine--D-alanine ligase [Lactococcus hodotermopsidis]GFH42560.1 D-alanine--D-alanine ligase [Lactococcus hodotermopsidis]